MEEQRIIELVERYSDTVLRLGYTWLGNVHDAQDLCQTVFLKLLTHEPPVGEGEKPYILRMAVNQCKDWKRSAWFRKTVPIPEGLELEAEPPREEDGSFLQAVQSLPEKYRQVVYLRYYEEYSVKEIAELLGIKPALVSTRLARAREKLKTSLGGENHEKQLSERA